MAHIHKPLPDEATMRYLLLFGTVAALAVGQILFKLASRNLNGGAWGFLFSPVFILALAVYGVATLAWIFALRQWPLTIAYPANALAIVIVLVCGVLFFGESLNQLQILGLVAILGGLALLGLA
ncbi:EamA family transporter [Microvirga calopogonii]|uniref:EamA family transporter n=1 Tax=Microvirga calopogonii TaxID=2078013 RepID=UPI000E0D3122|nr:EamA family transporter [Microvirga calopogonii]